MNRRTTAVAAASLIASAAHAQLLIELRMPPGVSSVRVAAISRDGTIAVGRGVGDAAPQGVPLRWSIPSGEVTALLGAQGEVHSRFVSNAVTPSGLTIVGGDFTPSQQPLTFSEAGYAFDCSCNGFTSDVSLDGLTTAGYVTDAASGGPFAFLHHAGSPVQPLPTFHDDVGPRLSAISADAARAVGYIRRPFGGGLVLPSPVMWTTAPGQPAGVEIPVPFAGRACLAPDISSDGLVVLLEQEEWINNIQYWHAYRFFPDSGRLDEYPRFGADGRIFPIQIGGHNRTAVGKYLTLDPLSQAWIGDSLRGPRLIADLVAGQIPAGWRLSDAVGISDDGRFVVGNAVDPAFFGHAWLAVLSACAADYNADGFIDFFDLDAFVACFEGSCPARGTADFNDDGFTDFFDLDAFVTAFESGC